MGRAHWTPEEALINVIHTAASIVAYDNPDDLIVLPNACPPIPGEQDDDDLRAVAAIDVFRYVVNQYEDEDGEEFDYSIWRDGDIVEREG